jgi:PAS domain S-box-containing protein
LRATARLDATLRLLVVILSIDAFRTLFENLYFGAYFNAQFGLLPGGVKDLLGQPGLIFLPKFVNIIAACVVLSMLIRRWLPATDAENRARLETERQHQEVIAGIDGIVWQGDAKTLRLFSVSAAAERLLGYPLAHWTAEPDFWRRHLHPEDVDTVVSQCSGMDGETANQELIYRMIAADGRVVWLQAIVNRVQQDGQPALLRGISIDITKRRQLELKLAEEQRFITTIADNLPGLVTYWTRDLTCSFANRSLENWFGQPAGQVVGMHMREHLGEALFAQDSPHIRAVLAGQAQEFERNLVKADGTIVQVLAHYVPDVVDGAVRGFFALVSDITNIKSKEAQLALLEKSVARLTDVVMITEALPVHQPGPRIVYVNDAFERQTGYGKAEAIGRSPEFLLGPDPDRSALERIGAALEHGQNVHAELINYRKSGERFFVEIDVTPIANPHGEITHLVCIQRDISDRKRQEQKLLDAIKQLSDSEAFLSLVLQAVDAAITVRDMEGNLLRANRKAQQISGYSEDELKRPNILQNLVPPEEMPAVRRIRESRNAKDFPITHVNHWVSRTGERHLLRWTNVALTDDKGDITLQVSIGFDVTEQRRYETELIAAKNQAEQANRAKSSFLATMSHELRTPLNAVIGFSDVMSQQTFGPLGNERYVEYTRDICNSGKQLLSIINDILDLSRIEAGKSDLKLEELRLSEVWSAIAAALEVSAATKSIRIMAPDPASDIPFIGDHRAVMQVITNLVGNAVKFTSSGGQIKIDCRRSDTGDDVVLQVSDTGRGIPASRIQDVMKPFIQVSSSQTRDAGGVGLGLAICKSLVSSMQGRIEIESELGRGTTLLVYLPIARAATHGTPSRRDFSQAEIKGGPH